MEIIVNEFGNIQLEEVFNPVVFRTDTGEQLIVTMRDGGYEVSYENQMMDMKQGVVTPIAVAENKFKEVAKGKKPNLPIQEECGLEGAHSFRHQILDMSKVDVPNFGNRMNSAGLEHHLDMAYKKPLTHAIEVLQKNLIGDEDYRQGWKANIAMSLYDEVGNISINGDLDLHDMCNKAADRFLDLLIKDGDADKR